MWMHTAQLMLFALLRLLHNPAMRIKTYTLSPSKQAIAKSLGRSSHKALFRHVTHTWKGIIFLWYMTHRKSDQPFDLLEKYANSDTDLERFIVIARANQSG